MKDLLEIFFLVNYNGFGNVSCNCRYGMADKQS
jgi:hypothetical protein